MTNQTEREFSITKRQALSLFDSSSDLAAALGRTPGAVSHWPIDGPIPREHALRIRYELRPEAFDGLGRLIITDTAQALG